MFHSSLVDIVMLHFGSKWYAGLTVSFPVLNMGSDLRNHISTTLRVTRIRNTTNVYRIMASKSLGKYPLTRLRRGKSEDNIKTDLGEKIVWIEILLTL